MTIRGSGFPSEILHREGLYASEDFRKEVSIKLFWGRKIISQPIRWPQGWDLGLRPEHSAELAEVSGREKEPASMLGGLRDDSEFVTPNSQLLIFN